MVLEALHGGGVVRGWWSQRLGFARGCFVFDPLEETRLLVQIRAVDSQIYVVGVPWSGVEWWLVGLSWCLGE